MKPSRGSDSRQQILGPLGGETLRALVVFSALFVTLTGMAGHLALRELNAKATTRRLDLGREEASRIADAVAALGWGRAGIDFQRVRQNQAVLERVISERLAVRTFVRHVEVRDQLGGRLLFVARKTGPGLLSFTAAEEAERGAETEPVVSVPLLRGPDPEGEVRLGISPQAFQREAEDLARSLRMKVIAAGSFGVAVLVVGFLYVLHLIRKNRRLEQEKITADRRAYAGLLASGLAHEIRNPLNAMNMNVQMLEEELQLSPGAAGSDAGELLASTKSEIKRLEALVNNFLAFARPSEPRIEAVDLNELLRDVARFLQADFTKSGVELVLDLEPLLPHVEVDERQLKQALMNLLVNARQVLRSGGTVTLRSRPGSGGEAVVDVEDNGPGIPEEVRERIFDIFYSNRGGGTGLGLPIARQIVERHGGTISVESTVGKGSIFRIRLPRRHARPAAPAPATEVAS